MPQDAQEELEPEELEFAQLSSGLLVGVQPTQETAEGANDAVQVVVLRLRLRLLRSVFINQLEAQYSFRILLFKSTVVTPSRLAVSRNAKL